MVQLELVGELMVASEFAGQDAGACEAEVEMILRSVQQQYAAPCLMRHLSRYSPAVVGSLEATGDPAQIGCYSANLQCLSEFAWPFSNVHPATEEPEGSEGSEGSLCPGVTDWAAPSMTVVAHPENDSRWHWRY